jgi:GntR family transcriptional regulator
MADDGVAARERQAPVTVSDRIHRYENVNGDSHGPFESETARLGHEPSVTTAVTRRTLRVTEPAARMLVASGTYGTPVELDMVIRTRKMSADGNPAQYSTGYIPADIAAGTLIEQEDTGPGGVMAQLELAGHRVIRHTEYVRARRAADEEAAFLQCSRVLEVIHTFQDYSGRTVSVDINILPEWDTLRYAWSWET